MEPTKDTFDARAAALDELLGTGRSFDMVTRPLTIAGRRARLWVVNGYAEDALLERAISAWRPIGSLADTPDLQAFLERYVSVCDAAVERDRLTAVTAVFAGKTLLIIDGYEGGLLMDAKQFPLRSVEEPNSSKVLRGSHDGFVESIMKNAALLRRRIRDPALTLERLQVGGRSRADVALCYMRGQADEALIAELREKLAHMDVGSVAMSQESIAEAIAPKQWYNPFPKVRYTERPDTATACVMEGDVLLLIDNTPAVMIFPVSILRFAEEINDYYFPPLVGSYLRIVRLVVLFRFGTCSSSHPIRSTKTSTSCSSRGSVPSRSFCSCCSWSSSSTCSSSPRSTRPTCSATPSACSARSSSVTLRCSRAGSCRRCWCIWRSSPSRTSRSTALR